MVLTSSQDILHTDLELKRVFVFNCLQFYAQNDLVEIEKDMRGWLISTVTCVSSIFARRIDNQQKLGKIWTFKRSIYWPKRPDCGVFKNKVLTFFDQSNNFFVVHIYWRLFNLSITLIYVFLEISMITLFIFVMNKGGVLVTNTMPYVLEVILPRVMIRKETNDGSKIFFIEIQQWFSHNG